MVELPWVDESTLALSSPIIFHYTGLDALTQILKSGGMWATRYSETNDGQEFRAFRLPIANLAYTRLRPLVQKHIDAGHLNFGGDVAKADELTRTEAAVMFESLLKTTPIPPFITCFCSHSEQHQRENGILTMWRLYSAKNGRIALGFDTQALLNAKNELVKKHAIFACYLDRVTYTLDDPQARQRLAADAGYLRLFERTFEAIMEVGLGRRRADEVPNIGLDLDELVGFYVACASGKHPDFADEHEIRLVLAATEKPSESDSRTPVLRPKPGRVQLNYLSALTEVMIGPSKDQDKLAETVRLELESAGFSHVRLSRSNTPYRDTGFE